jgi:Low-density lipoprotein receptor repeat class B
VAVDWISKNIYWTDSGRDRIEVVRFDGTNRKSLVSDGLVNPRGIAIDPIRG